MWTLPFPIKQKGYTEIAFSLISPEFILLDMLGHDISSAKWMR